MRWIARPMGRLLGATLFVAMVTGMALPGVEASTSHQAAKDSCAAIGTYAIGHQSLPKPAAQPAVVEAAESQDLDSSMPHGGGVITGTISLLTYTPCGSPTTGSFWARLSPPRSQHLRPLVEKTTHGKSQAHVKVTSHSDKHSKHGGDMPAPIGTQPLTTTGTQVLTTTGTITGTKVVSATGTIAQDPAHSANPGYVVVSGTVTLGNLGLTCTATNNCPASAKPAVLETITFSGIKGRLKIGTVGSSSWASLTFTLPRQAWKKAHGHQFGHGTLHVRLAGLRITQ
jgi:hypothetical protein